MVLEQAGPPLGAGLLEGSGSPLAWGFRFSLSPCSDPAVRPAEERPASPESAPGSQAGPSEHPSSHRSLRSAGRGFWKKEPGGQRPQPAVVSPARPRAGLSTQKAAWQRRHARCGRRGDGAMLVPGRRRPGQAPAMVPSSREPDLWGARSSDGGGTRGVVSSLGEKQDGGKATAAAAATGAEPRRTSRGPVAHTLRRFFSGKKTVLNFSNEISSNRKERKAGSSRGGKEGPPPTADGAPRAPPGHAAGHTHRPSPRPPAQTHSAAIGGCPCAGRRATAAVLAHRGAELCGSQLGRVPRPRLPVVDGDSWSLSPWPDTAPSQATCRERPRGCPRHLLHAPPPQSAEGP